jgi:glycosyltransferase involved in cell wall biosynthesis
MPTISVVVPTFNRADSLIHTLRSLVAQTLSASDFEVIVVDDGSSDDTQQKVVAFGNENASLNLRYVRHSSNKRRPAACNTGIREAHGELVVFADDDIRPVPGWLEAHVCRHVSENRDLSVTGPISYPLEWAAKSNWVRFANDNYRLSASRWLKSGTLSPSRFAGGNTSSRRETFLRVGLFDEDIGRTEDVAMGCRMFEAGVPLVFEEKAIVYHYAEAITSIDTTLRCFRRSFEMDTATFRRKFPWFAERYGHWFLQPPNPDYDTFWRRTAKCFVQIVARRPLERIAVRILKLGDGVPWLYWRPLYRYVQLCEAVDSLKAFRKSLVKRKDG